GNEGSDQRHIRELDDRKASRKSERRQTLESQQWMELAGWWQPLAVTDATRVVTRDCVHPARAGRQRPDDERSKHPLSRRPRSRGLLPRVRGGAVAQIRPRRPRRAKYSASASPSGVAAGSLCRYSAAIAPQSAPA